MSAVRLCARPFRSSSERPRQEAKPWRRGDRRSYRVKLSEVMLLRQGLEGAAARLAAARATEELANLEALCAKGQKGLHVATVQARSTLDREFHMLIAQAARSPRLVSLVEEFYEYSFNELAPPGNAADLQLLPGPAQRHCRRLACRDSARAEQEIRAHLETIDAQDRTGADRRLSALCRPCASLSWRNTAAGHARHLAAGGIELMKVMRRCCKT